MEAAAVQIRIPERLERRLERLTAVEFRLYFMALFSAGRPSRYGGPSWDGALNQRLAEFFAGRTRGATTRALVGLVAAGLFERQGGGWMIVDPQRYLVSNRKRRVLSDALRAAVIARDGYVCQLCGGQVRPDAVHIDHIRPRRAGGTDELQNLHVTHNRCNLVKGARLVVLDGVGA